MSVYTPYAYFHPNPGYLQIAGADRADFIQRQSTNDILNLSVDRHISTVLTNSAARIIDILQVMSQDDNTLGVVTLPGRGAATALFLKRRVFFMDKVTITDVSTETLIVDVEGKGAAEALSDLGIIVPEEGRTVLTNLAGCNLRIVGQAGPGGQSFRMISSASNTDHIRSTLKNAGIHFLDAEAYERLRILAGFPGPERELTEDYTPLETGLDRMISDTKGCYTGQEVIARQITYDKITRSLVGVLLEEPAAAGAKVLVGGQNVGTVTSYAESEISGRRALAVIKRPHFEPGTVVQVEANGSMVSGVVAALPFS